MNFRTRLQNGETLIGTMITIGAPEVAEIMSLVGFDWLFLDGEHGPLETADIKTILNASGDRVDCLVRIPAIDEVPIKKALDLGATGIIAPQVNSAEQAAKVVHLCRYPPEGSRGTGLARAHRYGLGFEEYVATANQNVLVVIQAEHREAVENIEEIVSVDGIDCIFIGPYDLSASYGKSGQIQDPEIVAAIERVEEVCKSQKKPLGIFGLTSESVRPYLDRGFSLITVGIDTVFLSGAAKKVLRGLGR